MWSGIRIASGQGLHSGLQPLGAVNPTYHNLGARQNNSATFSADATRTNPSVVFTENAVNTGVNGPFASRSAAEAYKRANPLGRPNEGSMTQKGSSAGTKGQLNTKPVSATTVETYGDGRTDSFSTAATSSNEQTTRAHTRAKR